MGGGFGLLVGCVGWVRLGFVGLCWTLVTLPSPISSYLRNLRQRWHRRADRVTPRLVGLDWVSLGLVGVELLIYLTYLLWLVGGGVGSVVGC